MTTIMKDNFLEQLNRCVVTNSHQIIFDNPPLTFKSFCSILVNEKIKNIRHSCQKTNFDKVSGLTNRNNNNVQGNNNSNRYQCNNNNNITSNQVSNNNDNSKNGNQSQYDKNNGYNNNKCPEFMGSIINKT